jgi:hypothetical protein
MVTIDGKLESRNISYVRVAGAEKKKQRKIRCHIHEYTVRGTA